MPVSPTINALFDGGGVGTCAEATGVGSMCGGVVGGVNDERVGMGVAGVGRE